MPEPTWNLYLDDDFHRADTSVGSGANSNTGVPGAPTVGAADNWYDREGNKFRINSNTLNQPGGTNSWQGTALYRGGGENSRDQRVVIDYQAGTAPSGIYLRFNTSTTGCLWFNLPSGGYLGFLNALGGFTGQTGSWTWTYDNTKAYQADCRAWGVGPTNWAYKLTNTTDNVVVVDTSGTTNSGVTAAGAAGLDGVGTANGRVSRVRAYSGEFAIGPPAPVGTSISLTQTAINWTATVGGVSPVSLALHRSLDPLATLGAGTLVADVTATTPGTTYLDTPGGTAGTTYFYWLRATDSATPTPEVRTSYALPLATKVANFKVGFIGDSITEYIEQGSAGLLASTFAGLFPKYTLTITNEGAAGTASGDWLPAGSLLPAAITAFTAANVTHVCIMHGTNDARDAVAATPTTYKNNMTAICNALVAAGFKVVLNSPPCYRLNYAPPIAGGYSANSYALLPQYVAKLDELVNGTTIYKGDRQAFATFSESANTLIADWVHPAQPTGNVVLAKLWCEALGPILGIYGSSAGGGAAVGRIFGGL